MEALIAAFKLCLVLAGEPAGASMVAEVEKHCVVRVAKKRLVLTCRCVDARK
jgi:hypothetical protein